MHVHFFPEGVFQAIWRFFEEASHGLWRVQYKVWGADHVAALKKEGVDRFTTLVYAHKPGLADYLNAFVQASAVQYPALISFGTLFAGDGEVGRRAVTLFEDQRFYGLKLHPFVSNEDLDDARFFPAYDIMQALGKIVICHPGSAPVYPKTDGAARLRRVLTTFPQLKVVVAHCGAFEYGDYMALADDFEGVYFDTAMTGIDFPGSRFNTPGREFFLNYSDRILFGSDFPNIPYDYAHQVTVLQKLHLGVDIERKIFHQNARTLLGLAD